MVPEDDRLWVFGYGSLMWRPGFDYVDRRAALLRGYHRAPCVLSTHYRGTPEVPGLVVGLDRGGACRGIAFAVAPDAALRVIEYLYLREMVTSVYIPKYLNVSLDGGGTARALTFIANTSHCQYAGRLAPQDAARLVRQGLGRAGTSREYVHNIVRHLEEFGIRDGTLHALLDLVDRPDAGP